MIDLTKLEDVKVIQKNLTALPIGDPENLKFLESLCGWYDFSIIDKDELLNMNGRRQVLATIKTLLRLTPDQIVALEKQRRDNNG